MPGHLWFHSHKFPPLNMIVHSTDKEEKFLTFPSLYISSGSWILEKPNCTKCLSNQTIIWFHCTGSLGAYSSTHVFASRPIQRDLSHVTATDVSCALLLTTSNERCSFKRQEQDFILTRCQEVQLEPLCLWIAFFSFMVSIFFPF